jgi:hypothetical protein
LEGKGLSTGSANLSKQINRLLQSHFGFRPVPSLKFERAVEVLA